VGEASIKWRLGDGSVLAAARARALAGAFGLLATALGALAVIGWALGAPALARLVPGLPPMIPSTAFAVIAAGVAVALARGGRPGRTSRSLALVPLVIGVITLLVYASALLDGFDRTLVPPEYGVLAVVGRPAPHTAAAFVLAGAALLAVTSRPAVAQGLATATALVALVALVGHVYSVTPLYGISQEHGMAVQTALALLAVGAGIVLLRPDRALAAVLVSPATAGIVARRLLLPALAFPILAGWAVLSGQRAGLYDGAAAAALLVLGLTMVLVVEILLAVRAIRAADQRRAEAEAARLEAAVREVEARALVAAKEEALRGRDEFLAIAAHELRTPLAALRMQVQLAVRRAEGGFEATRPRLEAAERVVRRVGRLVEELLDVSRINSGRLAVELELEDVDLAAVLREAAARLAEDAARNGSAIRVSGPESCAGRWDRLRIEQVMGELLSNALKYGAGRPVDASVGCDAQFAYFTVRDRGIGVKPEEQERIFDRFERAVSIRHYGGFGLGLWITREIVEAHGGRITVESAPGEGATFTAVFPRAVGASAVLPDGNGSRAPEADPIAGAPGRERIAESPRAEPIVAESHGPAPIRGRE
jgi:signal transduction histidine kinase